MRTFALAIALLMSADVAPVNAGMVSIFREPAALNCEIFDSGPSFAQYYVVHTSTPGATEARFSAPLPACHTGVWLTDTPVFNFTTGDSQNGVIVPYGQCLTGTIHVLTINIQTFGTTPTCCGYCVWPYPGDTSVEVIDCSGTARQVAAQAAIVNPAAQCFCGACSTVPVEESSWGRIKSLYLE